MNLKTTSRGGSDASVARAGTAAAPKQDFAAPLSNADQLQQVVPDASTTTPVLEQAARAEGWAGAGAEANVAGRAEGWAGAGAEALKGPAAAWAGAGAQAGLKSASKPKSAAPGGNAAAARTNKKKDVALSTNPGVTTADAGSLNYKNVGGKAFIKGAKDKRKVEVEDVNQGGLGDCYMMAGMAAVAQANPKAIENAIKDNGDGTFNVTLYKNGKPVTVKVDGEFPVTASGNLAYADYGDKDLQGRGEIWPALIEKAYAVLAQKEGEPGYEEMEGGLPGDAVEAITGKSPTDYDPRSMGPKSILSTIQKALDNKSAVSCATLSDEAVTDSLKKDFDKYGIHANHCYTFYSVDVQGQTVLLRNPWGSDHPAAMPVSVFKKCFDTLSVNKGV